MNNTIKYDVNEQLPDELGDFIQNFKALTQTLYHSNVIIKNQNRDLFLQNHFIREIMNDGEDYCYKPKYFQFKFTVNGQEKIVKLASSSLTSSLNLFPKSLELSFKPNNDNYNISANIVYENEQEGYILNLINATENEIKAENSLDTIPDDHNIYK